MNSVSVAGAAAGPVRGKPMSSVRGVSLLHLALFFFALSVASALCFLFLVHHPVFDEGFLLRDVHLYATQGVSVSTVRAETNAPGPGSFLWMAAAVRALGGSELTDARIAVLVSWLLMAAAMFWGARFSRSPRLWYGAALVTLVFPHSMVAMATVLSEGPALLFAVVGTLLAVDLLLAEEPGRNAVILGLLGGLCLGLSIFCRQYFLALAPAAAFVFAAHLKQAGRSRSSLAAMFLALAASVLPILVLFWMWRGFSSPSMASGNSYQTVSTAAGMNPGRPLIALFYVLVYLVPFTFPAMAWLRGSARGLALIAAAAAAVLANLYRNFLLQPDVLNSSGPLASAAAIASRVPVARVILVGLLAGLATYNGIAVIAAIQRKGKGVWSTPLVLFAVATIVLFVAEQVGVGGNLLFFDRYVLEVGPFFGLLTFWILPELTAVRISVLAAMSLFSQLMLWRYAF